MLIFSTESLRLTALDAKTDQDYHDNKKEAIEKTKYAVTKAQTETERLKTLKEEQDTKREELKIVYETYNELQRVIGEIRMG
jgi:hypothetical protein